MRGGGCTSPPSARGVLFSMCHSVTSVLLQSVHRSFLCVTTTREIRKLICFFLSPVKNKASIIVDVEVNLGWQSSYDSRLVFRSLRVQVSFWGCSESWSNTLLGCEQAGVGENKKSGKSTREARRTLTRLEGSAGACIFPALLFLAEITRSLYKQFLDTEDPLIE